MRFGTLLPACALAALVAPAAWAAPATVTAVSHDAGRGVLVIEGAGGLRPSMSWLDAPRRLVIDLPGSRFSRTYQQLEAIAGTPIQRVRVGQYQADVTRVVLDLSRNAEFKVVPVGDTLVIPLRPDAQVTVAATPAPEATPATAAATPTPAPLLQPLRPAPALITALGYAQGTLSVEMDRRVPYWSYTTPGKPTTHTVVFPHARLAAPLAGRSHAVNSFGIFRYQATQVGDDARVTLSMAKPPSFYVSAGARGWRFAMVKPTATPRPTPAAVRPAGDDEGDGGPKWARSSDAPLTFKRVGDRWLMAIRHEGRLRYSLHRVGNDRFHVDLAGARLSLPRDSVYIDDGLIARVRTVAGPTGTRLTIDLDQPVAQGARLINQDRTLLLSFVRSAQNQVTVDPGHGGTDHGAIGTKGTREKDVTLAIATRLSRLMESNGMSVQMTRMKDLEILLRPRVEMANRNSSDVFISIHANSFGKIGGVSGIETYYFSDESYGLAKSVHRQLIRTLKRPDRGVRKNNFYVVHHTKMPAALVEIGYLSNAEEEALLTSPAYQERAAQAIFSGIQDFLRERQAKP